MAAIAMLLTGVSVWVLLGPPMAVGRLHHIARQGGDVHSDPLARSFALDLGRPGVRATVCALGGAGLAVLVGGLPGLVAGAVAAVVGFRLLAGLETVAARRRSQQLLLALPLAATLVAACLRAGRPVEASIAAVAAAVRGPLGVELAHVAASLSLGASAAVAWRRLLADPSTAKMARTLVRTEESGAPLVATLEGIARQARGSARALATQRANAVGVKAAAPLGLCFLPAFVAVGLVPVIAGVVTNVIHQII